MVVCRSLMINRAASHPGLNAGVVLLQIMQAQQIQAVIVAVGCPDQGMNMKFGRQGIGQKNPRVMVELNHHHRALDAVVKGVFLAGATDPAKAGLVQMPLDFAQAGLARPLRHGRHVLLDQGH